MTCKLCAVIGTTACPEIGHFPNTALRNAIVRPFGMDTPVYKRQRQRHRTAHIEVLHREQRFFNLQQGEILMYLE